MIFACYLHKTIMTHKIYNFTWISCEISIVWYSHENLVKIAWSLRIKFMRFTFRYFFMRRIRMKQWRISYEFYASHVCLCTLIPYRNVRDDSHFYLSYLTYLYVKDINVFHLPCTRQISPQLLIYNANKNTMLKLIRVSHSKTETNVTKLCKGPQ